MVPGLESIGTLNNVDYQERLRHAAQQRLAASACAGGHPRPLYRRLTPSFAIVWLRARAQERRRPRREPESVSPTPVRPAPGAA